ncbi:hypothetical protein HK102_009293 [Quaeritorhiza haematococci]|nr:hypothetical protein HK102_009293 [Quaeritorhiza haematococci]
MSANHSGYLIPKDLVTIDESPEAQLGKGGFGTVKKGYLGTVTVAVKVLNHQPSLDGEVSDLKKEVEVLQKLKKHPNVVAFFGLLDLPGNYALVLEYAENGSLWKFKDKNPLSPTWPTLHKIALGVAKGMAHLHSNGVVHCDLKGGNILLTATLEPKITDFGLSVSRNTSSSKLYVRTQAGTILWQAPELDVGANNCELPKRAMFSPSP